MLLLLCFAILGGIGTNWYSYGKFFLLVFSKGKKAVQNPWRSNTLWNGLAPVEAYSR